MKKRYKGAYFAKTDIGRVRISNEDQAGVSVNADGEVFLVVCDGMGGQNKGDYASKMAIDCLLDAFNAKRRSVPGLGKVWLTRALREANSLIFSQAEQNPIYQSMGTTVVCVYISGDKMVIANIGDSRAYGFYNGKMDRLTEDQTYVDYLYRTGRITKDQVSSREDRHVLMNALGIYPSASMDMKVKPYYGQSSLLCSDGLYNNLPEPEIRAILSTDERPDQKVLSLIAEANGNGGSDNIAIAYWEALHD